MLTCKISSYSPLLLTLNNQKENLLIIADYTYGLQVYILLQKDYTLNIKSKQKIQ